MEAFIFGLLAWSEIRLGNQVLTVEKIYLEPPFNPGERVVLETLSPIVASTGLVEGGKMRKVFLSPESEEFSRVITENLQYKALALWGKEIPGGKVEFKPIKLRPKLVPVHRINVRCYEGIFEVKGHPELILLGYEAGFGERNFQGFGMMRPTTEGTNES